MTPSNPPSEIGEVRRYYDLNTARFERFGQGRDTGTIHRAVWGPGVRTRSEAFRYLDDLVLAEISPRLGEGVAFHLVDLGCGVGASLVYLASRLPVEATGITLSGVQARRAGERIAAAGLEGRVRCLEGSYLEIPGSVPKAHAAFSIEAFIHGPSAESYFASAAGHLERGGLLVVCDDFVGPAAEEPADPAARRLLERIRSGWMANTLVTPAEATRAAETAGLRRVKDIDLTAYLELGRPRDRLIAGLAALMGDAPIRSYYLKSLVGGSALQVALRDRVVEFRAIVFEKA